jgi:hypothetical protein
MKNLTGLLLFFFVASCYPIMAQQVRSTSSFELGLISRSYCKASKKFLS